MIKLTLPSPPSANRLWRNCRGVMVKSEAARQYALDVAVLARAARVRPLEGDVKVIMAVYRQRKAGDLDNKIKIVLDSLQGLAFENDSQVVKIEAHRYDDARNPRVEVTVEKIEAIAA